MARAHIEHHSFRLPGLIAFSGDVVFRGRFEVVILEL